MPFPVRSAPAEQKHAVEETTPDLSLQNAEEGKAARPHQGAQQLQFAACALHGAPQLRIGAKRVRGSARDLAHQSVYASVLGALKTNTFYASCPTLYNFFGGAGVSVLDH